MDIDARRLLDAPVVPLQRRTADVIVDVLVQHGVEVIFGIPGGPIAPIYDALLDRPQVRVITTRHESGAMFAAAGYAKTTGKLGVVLVTSGPGVLNAMTGLASANCDGIPVLLLAGEVPRNLQGRGALQDGSAHHLNVVGMASHICKEAVEVTAPNAAPTVLKHAITSALSGRRGPVLVTLPIDITSTLISPPTVTVEVQSTFEIPDFAIDRAIRAFSSTKRRLIFAGSGVRNGRGAERLRQLAELIQCPVMTTPKAKGVFPEDHPLSLGVFGLGGHPSTSAYLEGGVDTLLAIGTGLGDLATNGWSTLLRAREEFIQVDIDAAQIGRSYAVSLGIAAPAEQFLTRMLQSPRVVEPARFGVTHHDDAEVKREGPSGLISPQRALWEIQQVLPKDTLFTSDIGEHSLFATHYLRTVAPDAFVLMGGLGSMGSGICSALGVQLAHPDRTVAVICGDGGFAMAASEVATAVAEKLPVLFFVFDDHRLGMVELGLNALYGRSAQFPLAPFQVSELAVSLGAQSLVAEHAGDLQKAGLMALRARGPVVVDVLIDRSFRMPKNGRFEALGNITARKVMN